MCIKKERAMGKLSMNKIAIIENAVKLEKSLGRPIQNGDWVKEASKRYAKRLHIAEGTAVRHIEAYKERMYEKYYAL